jgi:hypothetical protein
MPRLVKKSKPIGIRFDIDKSKLIMERENIPTYQCLVNVLINKYSHQAPSNNIQETPKPLSNNSITIDDCPYSSGIDRAIWINQNLKK